jgi:hypothetical protein
LINVKVGIPREVKNHEYRVAITPSGVHELVRLGHEVFVEKEAGVDRDRPLIAAVIFNRGMLFGSVYGNWLSESGGGAVGP